MQKRNNTKIDERKEKKGVKSWRSRRKKERLGVWLNMPQKMQRKSVSTMQDITTHALSVLSTTS